MWSLPSLLVLALPLASVAVHQPNVDHRELAKRAKGDLLEKREYTNAKWTFYTTGEGACGGTNVDSDYIVALNQDTFGSAYPSQYCWKMITMTYNGKTATAQVVDSCPGCPSNGGLDLSPGLFSFFADEGEGVIYGSWDFVDGSGGGGGAQTTTTKQTPAPKETTTSTTSTTHHTTSTTAYTPPPTSTTSTTTSQTSSTASSSKESSASHSSSASTSAASSTPSPAKNGLAAASGTVSPASTADPENLYSGSEAFLALVGFIETANAAK